MKKKVETESSSTETDQKLSRQKSQQDSLERTRKKLHRKSSLVIEQSESPSKNTTSQRTVISKSIEAVKNNTVDSKSDSSSSTHHRMNLKNGDDKDEPGGIGMKIGDGVELQERVMCSPGIDLTSNPNVTYVSNTSIPELR